MGKAKSISPRARRSSAAACLWTVLVLGGAAGVSTAGTIYFYKDDQGISHFANVRLSERYEPLYTFREPAPAGPFRPQFRAPGSGVSAAASPAAREEIRQVINRVSPQHGLDPCLVQAVVEIESNYAACAVSPKGAQGLMQIMPATQRDLGLTSPFDPHQNIDAGIRYLKYLMQKFGSVHLALAAYNAGPAEVERHSGIPPFPETQDYVTRVMSKYLWYKYIR